MGFRCSLLGHDYDEPATEEEREERGNEVVVTVRELETCSRCGAETVISENTEVRSIDAVHDADASDDEPAADAAAGADAGSADAESADAGSADETTAGSVDDEIGDVQSAAEDDAVILDDDDDAGGDGWPGESPDADADDEVGGGAGVGAGVEAGDPAPELADGPDAEDESATDLTEWPDPGVEDEGFDAQPSGDDGVDVEFDGSLQPATASADADEGEEFVSGSGTGITSTGPVEHSDDVNTVLVCPECEFDAESVTTSQRPGDICPECRRGYLTERER